MTNGHLILMPVPAEGTPEGEIELIHAYIREREYGDAVSQVEKFLERYEGHAGREEAMMLAGDAEVADERYMQAFEWYEKQLDEFPAGRFSDRVLVKEFQIASAFLAGQKQVVWGFLWLGAEDEGIEILTRVAEHAPLSTLAEDALLMVGDYHYSKAGFGEAAEAYDDYMKLFPKSPRGAYAMFRAARAVLSMYRGAEHQDMPLVSANLRFRNFAENYPAAAEAMNVADILDRIAKLRTEKDYNTAKLYERLGRPQAARFYYLEATRRYGDNEWSDLAAEAVKRIDANLKVRGDDG